jgi:sodium-dependent dicarboxylate transporter 2/3/5
MFAFFVNFRVAMKNIILAIGLLFFISTITLTGGKDIFWNSIALGGLMIYFWVFEVIPIYITALFPLIFAIPLGVLEKSDLATSYGDSNVYLFFGGFLLALGLEKWNVHQQIAKGILKIVGNSKPRILLGFLFSTGLLSMWISNTATALMMLPMAMAIIEALPAHQRKGKFAIFLLLSVAYAASIGGVGTLIGSPPNVQMASTLESTFGVKVDFLDWMKIGLPLSITMLLCTYLFFYIAMGKERKEEHADLKLSELGWNKDQRIVLFVFLGVIILWSFKDLIVDWTGISYRDENAAILGGILLFLIPSSHEKKKMLEWKDTEKLPWGILLLFGGGLALAQIFEKNGVMAQLSKLFSSMHDYSFVLILIAVIVIAVFASEVLSNLAMVSIFVPLVATFALDHGVPIEKLAIPLTLGASLAFMLPVGTPPNAIVFSSGYLKVKQMVMYGLVLNIIGIILITLFSILFL